MSARTRTAAGARPWTRGVLVSAALRVQRYNLRVPRIVSRLAYALVGGRPAAHDAPPDEDWPEIRDTVPSADDAPPPGPGPVVTPVRPAVRCLLATHVFDAGGGIDEMIAFLARGLPRHGVETAVLYTADVPAGQPGPGGRLPRLLAQEGVPVAKVSPQEGTRWMAEHRPDVISAHACEPWVLDAAETLGIPLVDTLHNAMDGLLSRQDWRDEVGRSRRLSGIVTVSEMVRRQYLARNPAFAPERITTVQNGVNVPRLAPIDRRAARRALGWQDGFRFVCLARHALQKNLIGLVRAFLEVAEADPDAHLLIAGRIDDPLYHAQVRELRDRSPYADRVELRGLCPYPQLLLAGADAFVLDSFFEGGPIVSMEALVAGIPVVISDAGAAREQLGPDGERGYVVANPLGDPLDADNAAVRAARYRRHTNHDALVAAMATVLRDRAEWAAARGRLRADALRRFHPDVCLGGHARVLARATRGLPVLSAAGDRR